MYRLASFQISEDDNARSVENLWGSFPAVKALFRPELHREQMQRKAGAPISKLGYSGVIDAGRMMSSFDAGSSPLDYGGR